MKSCGKEEGGKEEGGKEEGGEEEGGEESLLNWGFPFPLREGDIRVGAFPDGVEEKNQGGEEKDGGEESGKNSHNIFVLLNTGTTGTVGVTARVSAPFQTVCATWTIAIRAGRVVARHLLSGSK